MSNVIQYAGVNSKVKALMGKLLSVEDYRNLINMMEVQDIFEYLYQQTTYSDYLDELAGTEIHRRRLELMLKKSLVNDYEVIYRYLTGSARKFFSYLFAKFEIEDLKMLLRTILVEHDEDYLTENLVYLGVHTGLSLEKLAEINNYDELLSVFTNTRYFDTLQRFADRYKEDKNLFPIEMTLDFNYFSQMEKKARKLSKADYKVARDLLGAQVDLLNIQWVYRIKRYYKLDNDEVLNYTLPFHYRLTERELREIVQIEDPDEIFNYLSDTAYNTIFSSVEENKGVLFEKYFLSYILKKAYHIKVTGTFDIGEIIAYLFIKEYEIRDIITIVEGVRYSLPGEEIRNYLIKDGV